MVNMVNARLRIFPSRHMNRSAKNNRRLDRGAALLELAIVLPVALFIGLGVVDLGQALNQYLALVRAGREAISLGARTTGLEPTPSNSTGCATNIDNTSPTFSAVTASCTTSSHLAMHQRAQMLYGLMKDDSKFADFANTTFQSSYDSATGNISFKVTTQIKPALFGKILGGFTVSAGGHGKYLLG